MPGCPSVACGSPRKRLINSLKRALGAELRAIVRENEHARQRDREALEAHIGSLRLRIDGE
jgi:hypothetical protein